MIVAQGNQSTYISTTMLVKYADQELILPIEDYIDNNTKYIEGASGQR